MSDEKKAIIPLTNEEVKEALGFEQFMKDLSEGKDFQKLLEPIAKMFGLGETEKKLDLIFQELDKLFANQRKIADGLNKLLERSKQWK